MFVYEENIENFRFLEFNISICYDMSYVSLVYEFNMILNNIGMYFVSLAHFY